jgi:hypothetical protein
MRGRSCLVTKDIMRENAEWSEHPPVGVTCLTEILRRVRIVSAMLPILEMNVKKSGQSVRLTFNALLATFAPIC